MIIRKMKVSCLTEDEFRKWFCRMPEKKQAEVISYRREADKKCSVCGYMLAVKSLSEFLHKDENEIRIFYDENGKPFSDSAFVSISHTEDYAVCAVSDKVCGVDAETVGRKISLKTALRVCTENELKYIFGEGFSGEISSEISTDNASRFIEVWTKKEAFGKMTGKGIAYDMKNTDLSYIKTENDGKLIISAVEMG